MELLKVSCKCNVDIFIAHNIDSGFQMPDTGLRHPVSGIFASEIEFKFCMKD
jgi:hypothetical protein